MDELELLKKDWQKDDKNYPKLSYNQIYKMILKKSSSIVKWIFIISIIEFVFWSAISLLLKDNEHVQNFDKLYTGVVFKILTISGFIILAYFFYRFFMNYRTISAVDSAKKLMENILKTRRTVKQYVAFNIIYLIIGVITGLMLEFKSGSVENEISNIAADGEIFKYYAVIIITIIIAMAIIIGVLLLFYWLVYGILLKHLNKNYKELKKLEV